MDYVAYIAVDREGRTYSRYGRDLQFMMFREQDRGRQIIYATAQAVRSDAKLEASRFMKMSPGELVTFLSLDALERYSTAEELPGGTYRALQRYKIFDDIWIQTFGRDLRSQRNRWYDDGDEGPDSFGIGCPVTPTPPPRSPGYRELVPG